MIISKEVKDLSNSIWKNVDANDFSSFIKAEFKNDVLIDLSEEKAYRDSEYVKSKLIEINDLKNKYKSIWDITALEALEDYCRYIISNYRYHIYKFNVTHNTCPITYLLKGLDKLEKQTKSERERYIYLLDQFSTVFKEMELKLRKQISKDIILPEEEYRLTLEMFESFKFTKSQISKMEKNNELLKAVDDYHEVLDEFTTYLKNDYCKYVGDKYGAVNYIGGIEYYYNQIKTYTSYDYRPGEIHDIGLKNIEITKDKIRKIMEYLGYKGSIKNFHKEMTKNKLYYDKTSEELQKRMRSHLEKIRLELPKYFYKIPKSDCDVQPIEKEKEGTTSWGYYHFPNSEKDKGIYYFSGAELDNRSQIRSAAIVYHELLPGHHFQMSLAAEDERLTDVCRYHFNTAYADGWAEYCADFANEIGMYNAYDLYGRYLWDLILSTRLVVDTGINYLGWSLEKIRKFMRDNTTLTEMEIKTESLRYAVDMPGQALAYKMGSLKMHELRTKSQLYLGEKFEIKDYHENILEMGSIPLDVLERHIEAKNNLILKG